MSDDEPEPALVLYDADGNVCVILTVNGKGPSLYLLGSKKTASLELNVTDLGADISLFDENFLQRLALKVIPWESGGVPSLNMRNANGMDTVTVTSLDNGPSINLSDSANASGNTGVRLQVDDVGPMCIASRTASFSGPRCSLRTFGRSLVVDSHEIVGLLLSDFQELSTHPSKLRVKVQPCLKAVIENFFHVGRDLK